MLRVFGRLFAIALLLGGCTSAPEVAVARRESNIAPAAAEGTKAVASPIPPARAFSVAAPQPANRQHDAYVLLSGGGTPLSNNYSQYLQARALAEFFERECPPERTWIFFGVGNRDGEPPRLADARRERKHDGFLVQSWVPGPLPRNRPATRDSFLRALREEILPLVRDGGTLYLFVGDHGELTGSGEAQESAITMWQLKEGRRRSRGWYTDEKEVLGVAELREVLAAGLGGGRVVFGMTQCHGGGFHELAVRPEMIPPRAWFAGAPPSWAVGNASGLRLRAGGFTATDQASPAAGCDADPDPERWAGYERFLPESLLGIDLMSGRPKGGATASLASAHEAATLVDHTIDKPRATSEHYLEAWARLIETKLARTLQLTGPVHDAVARFERAVNSGRVTADDGRLRERQAQFARFTERLAEQVPAAKRLLLTGTRKELEAAIEERERGTRKGGRRGSMAEVRRAWSETLRPAWKAAVQAGKVAELDGAALAFEKHLLKLEDDGRDFLLSRGGSSNAFLNELYWMTGYAEPASLDRTKAEAVAEWGAQRRSRIMAWARSSSDPRLRTAAEKIGPGPVFREEPPEPMARKTAAERVLFYRRVLAAWEFLVLLQAQPALAELQMLIELEELPVRPPAGGSGDERVARGGGGWQ